MIISKIKDFPFIQSVIESEKLIIKYYKTKKCKAWKKCLDKFKNLKKSAKK